jgi:hypothetical protein
VAHRFEMALTRAEFLRLLPLAVGTFQWQPDGLGVEGRTDETVWTVRFLERPDRRVGPLTLPVLDVTLACSSTRPDDEVRFVERFLRAYQRAGG